MEDREEIDRHAAAAAPANAGEDKYEDPGNGLRTAESPPAIADERRAGIECEEDLAEESGEDEEEEENEGGEVRDGDGGGAAVGDGDSSRGRHESFLDGASTEDEIDHPVSEKKGKQKNASSLWFRMSWLEVVCAGVMCTLRSNKFSCPIRLAQKQLGKNIGMNEYIISVGCLC